MDGTSPLGLNSPGSWGQSGAHGGVGFCIALKVGVQHRLSHPVGGRWMFVHRGTQRSERGMLVDSCMIMSSRASLSTGTCHTEGASSTEKASACCV